MLPRNHTNRIHTALDDRGLVANAGLVLPALWPSISACSNRSRSTLSSCI